MTTTPLLYITDGTTTVNLLSGLNGFYLKEWEPNAATFRGGGSRVTPLFNDGSWITSYDFDNVVETMTVSGTWRSPDEAAAAMSELRLLLTRASRYWTRGNIDGATPVYLVARAYGETNTRYAYIVSGQISVENNPFAGPFIQPGMVRVQQELDVVVERHQWQSSAPGSATELSISDGSLESGQQTFDSNDYADQATTAWAASLRLEHNITHMYAHDTSAATYSANLVKELVSSSAALFPSPMEDGDELYIGIEDGSAGGITAERFLNVVFDLSSKASFGTFSFEWEYYTSGSGWVAFNSGGSANELIDSGDFDIVGEYIVSWEQGGDSATEMAATSINGVTAFWVRCTVTVTTGSPNPPTQRSGSLPYTVSWPYFDVNSGALNGDLPTRLRYKLVEEASISTPIAGTYSGTSILMLGSRDKARGTNFSPYIWLSSRSGANNSNITVTLGGNTTNVGPIDPTPNGENALYNATTTSSTYEEVLTVTIGDTIADEYIGSYSAFLVAKQNGGTAGDQQFRLSLTYGGQTQWSVGPVECSATDKMLVIPLGGLTIGYGPGCTNLDDLVFSLQSTQHNTPTISFTEIVLIPTDEWFTVVEMPFDRIDYTTQSYFENDVAIDLSAICDPRDPRRAVLRDTATDNIVLRPNTPSGKVNQLDSGSNHRVFLLSYSRDVVSSSEQHLVRKYESVFRLDAAYKLDRYYSARGSS